MQVLECLTRLARAARIKTQREWKAKQVRAMPTRAVAHPASAAIRRAARCAI